MPENADTLLDEHLTPEHFIVAHPAIYADLLYHEDFTGSNTPNNSIGKVRDSRMYIDPAIETYKIIRYGDKVTPPTIKSAFDHFFDENVEKTRNNEHYVYSVSVEASFNPPIGRRQSITRGIGIDEQIEETEFEEMAVSSLKNDLKQDVVKEYYNDN